MMRKLVLSALVLTALATAAAAQVHVNGSFRRDGTYVQPHYRSSPNSSTSDNWSTRGNVNPYTGQVGTHTPPAPYTPLPTYPYVVLPPAPPSPYASGYLVPRR
jgi:hypothetical protein